MTFTQKQIDNKKTFRNEQGELNISEMRDTILRLIIVDNLTNQEIKQLMQLLMAFMNNFSDRTIH